MILIKGGRVVDPESGRDEVCDVLIQGNRVVQIAEQIERADCERFDPAGAVGMQVIDAAGMVVAPGLVDAHVHFREPGYTYKEDIISGAAAAAKGGFTTVIMMANTNPAIDNEETLELVLARGAQTGIHVKACGAVTRGLAGRELTDMEVLSQRGAAGFTDDGIPVMDESLIRAAMEQAVRLAKPISLHEEDPAYIENNGIHAGPAAAFYGLGGSSREAEISMAARDIALAEDTGAMIVIQHISTREAVELVRQAKKRGSSIFAEATPHHFTLTQEAVIKKGTLAKMNPPLREEEDRLAIIAGLADGTIDMIATDHAPHSREEKAKKIAEAPSGIIGLETALSLGIRELINKGFISLLALIEKMSLAAARLYGLDAGRLKVDGPADVVIFHPAEEWVVTKQDLRSKAANTPFLGERMPGVVYATICDGQVVYEKDREDGLTCAKKEQL